MHHLTGEIPENLRVLPVSGTYQSEAPQGPFAVRVDYETVRLDVDGTFPQMMASGSYSRSVPSLKQPTHWVAHPLRQLGSNTWEGGILAVWGDPSVIPHKRVRIHVAGGGGLSPRMTITFRDGAPAVTRTLTFASPYFREVAFEFDTVKGSPQVTFIETCKHDFHPSPMRCEVLTFDKVYDRAGVDVSRSRRRSEVELASAGIDQAWSDTELQDAMRMFWSSYADGPDWAVWVLFAGKGQDEKLAGKMFDDSDANQRQGVVIFNDTFERFVKPGFPQRTEHIRREQFFALVHETGHCFNLPHAWIKYDSALQWPFDDDIGGTASFMNYPDELGLFYWNFRYVFHNRDLKFLRHAPDRFVQMGDERFFYKGKYEFGGESRSTLAPWKLGIEVQRTKGVFEFLEPVTLTAWLTNMSSHPQIVDAAVLEDGTNFGLLIGRGEGGGVRVWRPFVQNCFRATPRVLEPGGSVKATFFVSAGVDGWYLAEPGSYTLQALLATPELVIAAEPLRVRIAHSCSWEEEVVAQDVFTKDIGRAFAFGASHGITAPVETLQRVMDRFPTRAVSRHAALALARPWMQTRRVLRASGNDRGFDLLGANPEEARRLYERALFDGPDEATRCFGARYDDLCRGYSEWLNEHGASDEGKAERAEHV